jgi:hypothetical protein
MAWLESDIDQTNCLMFYGEQQLGDPFANFWDPTPADFDVKMEVEEFTEPTVTKNSKRNRVKWSADEDNLL